MTTSRTRFAAPQRLLHWLMAICILSMLFIGVGMVSTAMPKHLIYTRFISLSGLPSCCWHSSVWRCAFIMALRRCHRTSRNRSSWLRISSQYILYALMISMPLHRLGHVVGGVLPCSAVRQCASAFDPARERQPAYLSCGMRITTWPLPSSPSS